MVTLLPPEMRKGVQRTTRTIRLVSRGLVFLLFFYLVVALVLGGFFAFTFVKKQQVGDTHSKLVGEVKAMKDKEASLVVLKDRVTALTKIVGDKTNFRKALELTTELVGDDAQLVIRDITNDQRTIQITIASTDSFALERLFNNIRAKDGLSQVTLESLSRFRDGEYIASLVIQL